MKQNLILLHGALGSALQFDELANLLKPEFNVFTYDFDGHGFGTDTDMMSVQLFSEKLSQFVRQNKLERARVFGYSMGGYVALMAQARYGNLFSHIITLGTKFDWSPAIAEQEIKMIDPEKIEKKIPKFAAYLASIQAPKDWKKVLLQTQELMRSLGNNPLLSSEMLARIDIPVQLCVGELDKMVSVEETSVVQQQIGNATMEIVKDVPHPIQQIDPKILVELIKS